MVLHDAQACFGVAAVRDPSQPGGKQCGSDTGTPGRWIDVQHGYFGEVTVRLLEHFIRLDDADDGASRIDRHKHLGVFPLHSAIPIERSCPPFGEVSQYFQLEEWLVRPAPRSPVYGFHRSSVCLRCPPDIEPHEPEYLASAHPGPARQRSSGSHSDCPYARWADRPLQKMDGCRNAHERRRAEAMCRRLEGAVRSEIVEQYAGGPSGRVAEIEREAQRPSTEIRQDVIDWSIRLDGLFESIAEEVWSRPVLTVAGSQHAVALLPFRRWREVEVHLVDLGHGVTPADWSDGLVDRALPRLVDGLIGRADQRELMAWLLGRGSAPELRPLG